MPRRWPPNTCRCASGPSPSRWPSSAFRSGRRSPGSPQSRCSRRSDGGGCSSSAAPCRSSARVMLTQVMPESPRYLVRHPSRWPELAALLRRMGHDIADQATFVQPAGFRGQPSVARNRSSAASFSVDTFALWGAFFSCLLAVYLGFSWLPSILTGAGLGTGGRQHRLDRLQSRRRRRRARRRQAAHALRLADRR